MDVKKTPAAVDEFLFSKGQDLNDYFIEQSDIAEMLRYRTADGHEVELPIHDPEFADAIHTRVKELGVKIVRAN